MWSIQNARQELLLRHDFSSRLKQLHRGVEERGAYCFYLAIGLMGYDKRIQSVFASTSLYIIHHFSYYFASPFRVRNSPRKFLMWSSNNLVSVLTGPQQHPTIEHLSTTASRRKQRCTILTSWAVKVLWMRRQTGSNWLPFLK
jgi:hypothetical protein